MSLNRSEAINLIKISLFLVVIISMFALSLPIVEAVEQPESSINSIITLTPSTRTECIRNICTKSFHSTIMNYWNGNEYVPIETEILPDPVFESQYDYGVERGVYLSFFKEDPSTSESVKFYYNESNLYGKNNHKSGFMTQQPHSLNYRNDLDQLEQISMVQSVIGTPEANTFSYPEAFGTGLGISYSYYHEEMKEKLIIDSFSSLPIPASYIVDGGNPTLDIDFLITWKDDLDIYIDGMAWDKQNTISTDSEVEFKLNDDIIFKLSKPYAIDSNNAEIPLFYEFKKGGNKLYVIVKTSLDWLSSLERVYPVYIDPTIKLQTANTENLEDTFVEEDDSADDNGDNVFMNVDNGTGVINRIYIKFNTTAIPNNSTILNSILFLYKHFGYAGTSNNVSIFHVLNYTWNENTVNWNDQPCGTVLSASKCNLSSESSAIIGSVNNWYNWTVTEMVRRDYGNNTNFSIMLTSNGSLADGFRPKESSNSPILNITYLALDVVIDSPLNITYVSPSVLLNLTVTNTTLLDRFTWSESPDNEQGNFTNVWGTANVTINLTTEGWHNITVFINQTNGLSANASVLFTIDTLQNLTIINPSNITYTIPSISLETTIFNGTTFSAFTWAESPNNLQGNFSDIWGTANVTINMTSFGFHNITVYAEDSIGDIENKTITFTIDSFQNLTIANPTNITYNTLTIPLRITFFNGTSISKFTWAESLDNEQGNFSHGGGTANVTLNLTTDGWRNITIYAEDSIGDTANVTVQFVVDTIYPQVVISHPENATYNDTAVLDLNFTLTEVNIDQCWYSRNETDSNHSINCVNQTGVPMLSGRNNLTFWVNDSAGNKNSTHIAFTLGVNETTLSIRDITDVVESSSVTMFAHYNQTNGTAIEDGTCSVSGEFSGDMTWDNTNRRYEKSGALGTAKTDANLTVTCSRSTYQTQVATDYFNISSTPVTTTITGGGGGGGIYTVLTEEFNITALETRIEMIVGTITSRYLIVTNIGDVDATFVPDCQSGMACTEGWVSFTMGNVSIGRDQTERIQFDITLPSTLEEGEYNFTLNRIPFTLIVSDPFAGLIKLFLEDIVIPSPTEDGLPIRIPKWSLILLSLILMPVLWYFLKDYYKHIKFVLILAEILFILIILLL